MYVHDTCTYWHRRTQLRTLVSVTQGTAAKSPRPVPVGVLDNPGMRASVQHISPTPSPSTHSRERDGTPRPQQRLHDLGPGLNAGQPVHEVVTLASYKRIPLDLAEENARRGGFVVCAEPTDGSTGASAHRMNAVKSRTHAGEHARSDARIRTFTTKVPTGSSPTAVAGYGVPVARASQ